MYPELEPLPVAPVPLPGPQGKPYTLADLQRIAATNSPQLRQAASNVEAARGNMIQANAYPNPTLSYQFTPSNNGSTPGADGVGVEQLIKTGGKLRLQASAAEMDFHNAELALRRARSDLATAVRNAYFAVLVAKETVRVEKALAHFTDEVYRLQARLLAGGFAALTNRRPCAGLDRAVGLPPSDTDLYRFLGATRCHDQRAAPATVGSGWPRRFGHPLLRFRCDSVHVLRNHTDALTASNGIEKARYNLKLAQVTPVPDVDVSLLVFKDYSLAPHQTMPALTLGVPVPVWDRNKGAIMAAEAALVRATEEPHRVEMNLTNTLAGAYMNYKSNLDACVLSKVHLARPGAHVSRRLRPPSDRPQRLVRRRGHRPTNAVQQRGDLPDDPGTGLDLGDERGRLDTDRRPVRVRQARGRASVAGPGTLGDPALLSSLRRIARRWNHRTGTQGQSSPGI